MVLRAAVPMLAVGAAEWRGVALGSVCTVYGVVQPGPGFDAVAGDGHFQPEQGGRDAQVPASGGTQGAHLGDHCALTALAELGVSQAPMVGVADDGRHASGDHAAPAPPAWGDASATWVARRKQGPPAAA